MNYVGPEATLWIATKKLVQDEIARRKLIPFERNLHWWRSEVLPLFKSLNPTWLDNQKAVAKAIGIGYGNYQELMVDDASFGERKSEATMNKWLGFAVSTWSGDLSRVQWNDLASELRKKPSARDEAARIVGASAAAGQAQTNHGRPPTQTKREPYQFCTREKSILISTAKSQPEPLGSPQSTKASVLARYDLLVAALHSGKHNMAANDPHLPALTESE